MYEKSENFNSLNQYFLSYVKKTPGGGGQIAPPPSRKKVKCIFLYVQRALLYRYRFTYTNKNIFPKTNNIGLK